MIKKFIEVFAFVADNYSREAMNRFAYGHGLPELLINKL